MPKDQPKNYGRGVVFALGGVLLTGIGLWLSAMSNPNRYPDHASFDRVIDLYAISGLGCTMLGIGLFLAAVKHTTPAMTTKQKRETNLGTGAGFLLQLSGALLYGMEFHPLLGGILVLAGIPVLIWSCRVYANAKGYSDQVGLLGLLGVIGLLLLLILPPRSDETSPEISL